MKTTLVALILIGLSVSSTVYADDDITPLVENGDWVAFEHRLSMSDPPDFCVAAATEEQLLFRFDNNDTEIRYSDDSWSLPANVSGQLMLTINGNNYSLDITTNTNNMVIAQITIDKLLKIISDMNKSSIMTVVAGSGKPAAVSLVGSNQAITAFLTCAGIPQPGNTGGTNQFQNKTATTQ